MMPATMLKRWGIQGVTSPGRYFATGVLLATVKLALDHLLAAQVFGRPWSLADYAFPGQIGGILSLDRDDQVFYLSMLALSLPFLIIGLVLTVRRLRDVGWPLWIAAMFFAPAPLNIVFFLVLAMTPGHRRGGATVPDDLGDVPSDPMNKPQPTSSPGRALTAILLPMPFAAATLYVATHVLREYGWSVFVGVPFVLPMISVILYGYHEPKPRTVPRLGHGLDPGGDPALARDGLRGMICLIMALPLLVPVVMLGVMVGYFIITTARNGPAARLGEDADASAGDPARDDRRGACDGARTPAVRGQDGRGGRATPDRVWRHVVAFPDLPRRPTPSSSPGSPIPIRARIEGRGVGAVRYCEFSTGSFVEPIEVWDEPRLLRFAVTSNPPPMREWNPFVEIHPPHLDGFLVSRRGQFLLTALPGGRTRLEGTTWYHHGLWPAGYWRLWSDAILHRIHSRVLKHVEVLAEGESRLAERTSSLSID